MTTKQLEETKAVYGQGNMIPENSVYADGNGMFAVFWGETPTLHVSKDDGETWTDFVFQEEYPRLCTSRIVRFLDPENGYVGLGTDWSMGTGGATYIGWTLDGGSNLGDNTCSCGKRMDFVGTCICRSVSRDAYDG